MASTKEQMLKARELIKAKKYDEARAILNKINHPTAKEWLAKLDNITPSKKSAKPGSASSKGSKKSASKASSGSTGRGLLLRVVVLVLIIALGVVAYLALNNNNGDADPGGSETTSLEPTDSPSSDDTAQNQGDSPSDDDTAQNQADSPSDDEMDSENADSPGLPPGLGDSAENPGPFPPVAGQNQTVPPFAQMGEGQPSNNGLPPFANVGGPPVGGNMSISNPLGGTISLEAPEGWSQQIPGLGVLSHQEFGDSIVVISSAPPAMVSQGLSLQALALALAEQNEQLDFTEHERNGRAILQAAVTADDGEQHDVYYVQTENNNIAIILVQPSARRGDALRDDILAMASTLNIG